MKRFTIGTLIKYIIRMCCLGIAVIVMIFMFLIAVLDASYKYDPPRAYESPALWRVWDD